MTGIYRSETISFSHLYHFNLSHLILYKTSLTVTPLLTHNPNVYVNSIYTTTSTWDFIRHRHTRLLVLEIFLMMSRSSYSILTYITGPFGTIYTPLFRLSYLRFNNRHKWSSSKPSWDGYQRSFGRLFKDGFRYIKELQINPKLIYMNLETLVKRWTS